MNSDQFIVILNFSVESLEECIKVLHKLNCMRITESNSVFKNGILISSANVNDQLINYLNNRLIKENRIICNRLSYFKSIKSIEPLENVSDKEILSHQIGINNEQILIVTKNSSFLFENGKPLKLIYEFPGQCVVSKTGRFICMKGDVVTLFANQKKFNEWNMKGEKIDFSEDDKIIQIDDFAFDIYKGSLVNKEKSKLKVENGNIFYEGKLLKNHQNLKSVLDFKSENRLFLQIKKKIGEREITIVESFRDGNTFNEIPNSEYLSVCDNYFLAVSKNKVFFFELKRGFVLRKTIKTEGLAIVTLNKYAVSAVCDIENVELYNKDILICSYVHPACTHLKWSHSNLFLCSFGTSGLIQVVNINGKLIWKKVFINLVDIQWRPFVKGIGDREKIKKETPEDEKADIIEIDVELLKKEWLVFLNEKKKILESYYSSI
ncbi:hypothetical protein DMUE_3177 [Dictyocoela muelleri]|nr:hypothetical protein DMUE_3177 [Dictyocoela muelleri]